LKTDISALEERAVATIADPAPLGLWAFATGTWMAGTVLGGAFASTTLPAMAPVLLIFAGLAQFIAGLYAFRRANSLAATAFCCFGSFNITAAAMFMLSAAHITPAGWDTPIFMGFLLESFAFIALALSFAALRRNAVLVLVLLTLAIGYCLTGIPNLALSVDQGGFGLVGHIGGWFLVASAALAYYGGMAIVVNSNWRRAVLPLGGEP
jgi:succinate-acetate transporter protein